MRYKEWRMRQNQRPQAGPSTTANDPWWTRPDNPQPGDPWWLRHTRRTREGSCWTGHSHPKFLVAVCFICAGALLFLENVGLVAMRDIWAYWPLILVVLGISRLTSYSSGANRIRGLILLVVGIGLLASNLGFLFIAADFAWPILLIVIGGAILLKTLDSHKRQPVHDTWQTVFGKKDPSSFGFAGAGQRHAQAQPDGSDHRLKEWVLFGNLKRRITSQDFHGGEVISIFGEINIDLRHAQMATGAKQMMIEANATFGAVNIHVPEYWRVSVRGAGIFGGYEDKTLPPRPRPGFEPPLLIITGAAIFGAVVVNN